MKKIKNKVKSVWEKGNASWETTKETLRGNAGIGVVEVILILVVLIGLVLIFKSQLTDLVSDIFETITSESSSV
ncbi:MAG: Flp1 family type IVb pilin [Eubacteriales bacterium]